MSAHHSGRPPGTADQVTRRDAFVPATLQAGTLTVSLDAIRLPLKDCWVAARWNPEGRLLGIDRGEGSLCIVDAQLEQLP
jgi:hypothetical protein